MEERKLARFAGALYLAVAALGIFAELYVRAGIVVSDDAGATAGNIRGSATLFRWGFASDLAQATIFLFTGMALYLLLRRYHEMAARAMVVFVAVSVAIMSLNLLNQYVALQIATGDAYTAAFGQAGSDALAGLFAGMQADGYLIAQMFFGLWLVPLGFLVLRSGRFPRALGWVLIAGGVGYVIDLFVQFLAPGVASTISPLLLAPAGIAEFWMVGYLLVKGIRPALPPEAPPVTVPVFEEVSR